MTQVNSPKIKSAPSIGFFVTAILGATFLGMAAVVFFFNPSAYGFYPICLFHKLTGLNCPGCGATRSFYAVVHGNFQSALKDNALFVCVLALAGVRGAWYAQRKIFRKPVGEFFPAKMLWPLLIAVVVFGLLRNLPMFSFLSP
ncbi:MAG TPA: DUF2752 domain-containing protein [Candidatus Baltobacteraceae bacterium]|nr:DUF2752 domain-containing protein [Candidatus Baltobacteraceae bacterium]